MLLRFCTSWQQTYELFYLNGLVFCPGGNTLFWLRLERLNSSLPASPLVGDPSALAADFCMLQDGTSPQSLTAGVYCGECAAGPWHSRRSFFQHVVKGHKVRHPLKNTVCPQCRRQVTEVSACRRHLERQSCGSVVNNHGRAGAIAGGLEQARSAVLAQVHHPVPQANLPSSSRQLDVRACFHG